MSGLTIASRVIVPHLAVPRRAQAKSSLGSNETAALKVTNRAPPRSGAPGSAVVARQARNTSWIIQSIRSRFGVSGTTKAVVAAAAAVSMGSMHTAPGWSASKNYDFALSVIICLMSCITRCCTSCLTEGSSPPLWKLKRSELRKIYNSYARATEKEAAMLTVPTEREKLWIPDDIRRKRAEYVEFAKSTNAAFLEVLVQTLSFFCSVLVDGTVCRLNLSISSWLYSGTCLKPTWPALERTRISLSTEPFPCHKTTSLNRSQIFPATH